MAYSPRVPFHQVAVGATTYASRTTDAPAQVDGILRAYRRSVIVDNGGYTDIVTSGLTAAALLTAHQTYVTARRAAGLDLYVATTLPDATTYTAPQETTKNDFNTLLRAADHYDALVDFAAIPELMDASDTTYFSDGLHFTAAGAAVAADAIAETLADLNVI